MNKDDFRNKLTKAHSSEEVVKLFKEEEQSYLEL